MLSWNWQYTFITWLLPLSFVEDLVSPFLPKNNGKKMETVTCPYWWKMLILAFQIKYTNSWEVNLLKLLSDGDTQPNISVSEFSPNSSYNLIKFLNIELALIIVRKLWYAIVQNNIGRLYLNQFSGSVLRWRPLCVYGYC